ncbi:MAG: APC family permease [bacterium]
MGKKLGLAALIWVIFTIVCGGPYGIEEAVPITGPGLTLILVLLIPLFWSAPISLMTAELSSALPQEGGYIRWVERAMGRFFSFQAGWLAWIRNIVDSSLYPVIFADYLRFWFPSINPTERWLICIGLIAIFALLNLAEIRIVGISSVLLSINVLLPFFIMVVFGFLHFQHSPWIPLIPPGNVFWGSFGMGLMIIIWNYNGWEDFVPCLGEIESPRKNYPRALLITVPMIAGIYFLSLYASLCSSHGWAGWRSGSFSDVGAQVGGSWLGIWLTLAIMVGAANQLMAIILSTSRIPFALAQRRFLPAVFLKTLPRTGVPWVAVLFCSVAIALMTNLSFVNLIEIEIYLYGALFLLEYLSLVFLRVKEPHLPREIRVPGGLAGAIFIGLPPLAVILTAVFTGGFKFVPVFLSVLAAGIILYFPFQVWFKQKGPINQNDEISKSPSD